METRYQKIIIKVGTNVITRPDGSLDITNISHLVDQIADLKRRGIQVVLVSSGAVGAGRELWPEADNYDSVVRRQVLSSIGQVRLMEVYRQLFAGQGLLIGQVLATKEDFRDRQHYLHMRNCLRALLNDRMVPIVNENDAVAITELMFTDNDELASLVTAMLNADALFILSSVDGLFDRSPEDPAAKLLTEIAADDESLMAVIAPTKTSFGRGGMATKLRMAQRTASLGAEVVLANGRTPNILSSILTRTARCTRVQAGHHVSNVKKWLAQNPNSAAAVVINDGAKAALADDMRVTSLLPVGISKIEGEFKKGDVLQILDSERQLVAVGVAQYDGQTARQVLGQKGQKPLVHYDYLRVF